MACLVVYDRVVYSGAVADISMAEAARLLGYNRQHVYLLAKNGHLTLTSEHPMRVSREEVENFKERPPAHKRPRATDTAQADLVEQIAALRERIDMLEREPPGVDSVTYWRRQASTYRSALLQLSDIGQDHEDATSHYDLAADKLNEAQAALREGWKAQNRAADRYRDTINALISPTDPDELNDWARSQD